MEVEVSVENERGCGYRQPGLYLSGGGVGGVCGRLPYPIKVCPTCGEQIRFTRGYQWIDGPTYFEQKCENNCNCHSRGCQICDSDSLGRCLFMWVGEKYYSPTAFTREAEDMGVSKRIAGNKIPEGVELGKTWCLLAHRKAYPTTKEVEKDGEKKTIIQMTPGIFYAFRIQRVEKVLTKKQTENINYVEALKKEGITPVVVKPLREDEAEDASQDIHTLDLFLKKPNQAKEEV